MATLKEDRKRRPTWMRAIIRVVCAWIGLAFVGFISHGNFVEFAWFIFVPYVFLAVTSPVMATSAIFLGRRAGSGKLAATGQDLDANRGMVAVVLGYLWWFFVCLIVTESEEGLAWFAFVVILIEAPRIIFEGGRGREWFVLAAILVLVVATGISIMGGPFGLLAPGIVGALELTVLAAWWPFREHAGLPNRTRILVGVMLYLFAVLALGGLYFQVGRPMSR